MDTRNELTTPRYWASFWQGRRANRYAQGLPWVVDWLHFQEKYLPRAEDRQVRLLEVGCAFSRWLPMYSEKFGYSVYGVDFNEQGCLAAKSILSDHNQFGNIACADFLHFATGARGMFDIVVSFGFVEHFETNEIVLAMNECLKPGGIVFAAVPNLQGFQGLAVSAIENWQETHILHSPQSLSELFAVSGFADIETHYIGGLGLPANRPASDCNVLRRLSYALFRSYLVPAYLLSRLTGWSLRGKHTASSIMLVGRKPGERL